MEKTFDELFFEYFELFGEPFTRNKFDGKTDEEELEEIKKCIKEGKRQEQTEPEEDVYY